MSQRSGRYPSQAAARVDAIAARFAALPHVIAIAWAGSQGAGAADDSSDLDLYIYAQSDIPLDARTGIAEEFAAGHVEIDNRFWEQGDEWLDAISGLAVDITYRSPGWIEDQLDRLLERHETLVGYSTCFWFNVLHSHPVYDPRGWYGALQCRAQRPYSDALAQAILAKNYPILRDNQSAYRNQIEKAVKRCDRVSLNHRVAALLASYFDCLFALNRLPHPGEKRLVEYSVAHCARLPQAFAEQVNALVEAVGAPWADQSVLACIDALVDGLDKLTESSTDSVYPA